MALALQVKITGVVDTSVVKVLVNGVNTAISSTREYHATVLVSAGLVGITTIDAHGVETVRTIQLAAVASGPG